jgi:hypothetical protein
MLPLIFRGKVSDMMRQAKGRRGAKTISATVAQLPHPAAIAAVAFADYHHLPHTC